MGSAVAVAAGLDHGELGFTQRCRLAFLVGKLAEEVASQSGGFEVGGLPKRGHARARPGALERLPQAGDAFAVADLTEAGLAVAEDDQLGAAQVEADDLQAGEYAVFVAGLGCLAALVAAGQEEAAAQQR